MKRRNFQDTLSMVKEVEYDQGFTFLYSIRKLKAAEMQNQIPHDIKQERFQRLVDSICWYILQKKQKKMSDRYLKY